MSDLESRISQLEAQLQEADTTATAMGLALTEARMENERLRMVAEGVVSLIDIAVMFENDLYGGSREENAKYRELLRLAMSALKKEEA